ncbi:AarF/UbiB family protein [Pseudogemmatithrix spongiicola]|uniref:AarF/UbiB family protein n=1 Tax=Pseudogemmatithrix spongiicola TaxID=3062599 RepID=A0AA49K139_9BACT|nr:AarF/UbiB family protein [Gemmatimonadaceae bacterium 'strain 138']WKW15832.1 AarF/UbiB family protein [Gemmatimonadaceae bacterium 'strain 318']
MLHTLRVLLALGPFVISILRDQRRWLWFGAPLLRSPEFHARRARALVARIAKLGPTFVKLAQVFAARADLIPEPYLSQLGTLTDRVPPVPWDAIERELRSAYGEAPERTFTSIDRSPIAAASLGQVHRATWRGRDVAVKVLRPGVEHTVERDLRSARAITAWAARRWPVPHVLGFQSLVEEFATRIAEEMDFRLEAEYATEVRGNFRGNPRVVIPEVMHELTRRRVLVLAFIDGRRVDRLPAGSVDAQRLAALVMEVYVQMMLVDGLFHADPHAGNLLFTADGRLVLLDFGMMVRVPQETRLALIRTVFASIRRDPVAVADGFTALGLVAPGADPAEIRRLAGILVELSVQRTTTQQRLETMLADRVMASLYDFPVILPRDLVYFARTAALIEGIGTRYDPYFNAIQVGTPLVMRMRSRILKSLGQEAEPSVEEYAAMAGWAVGRAWRRVREVVRPLLSGLALCLGLGAATALQAQTSDSLEARIAAAVQREGLIGVSWSLLRDDSVRLGAAGTRDVRSGAVLSPESRMQVGSVAKTVTALGVLRLVSQGRLDLDAEVSTLLDAPRIENPFAASSPLRVRHLLDHSAGLDDARLWQVFTMRGDASRPLGEGLPARLTLRTPPGRQMSYSNTGYLLAGMVIERVTGSPYEAWLDSAVLAPLGMTRSTTRFVTQADDSTLAMGHFDLSTVAPTVAFPVRPAIQLTTTAEDMARLARFLVSDGRIGDSVFVDAALLQAMARASTTDAARAGLGVGYALGLLRRDRYGAVGHCHLGNQGNFRAVLCVYPQQQRAMFASYNSDPESGNFAAVDSLLVDALDVSASGSPAAAVTNATLRALDGWYEVTPARFQQFAYLDALASAVRVTAIGDSALTFAPLGGTARHLTAAGSDRFRATGRSEASHVVIRNAEGNTVISDGTQTFARVSAGRLYLRWTSAGLGIFALLTILARGTWRGLRAIRHRAAGADPLRYATIGIALLLLAPVAYLFTDAMAIGDPTFANLGVAAATLLLPISLLASLAAIIGRGTAGRRVDLVLLVLATQWCTVLAANGFLPLMLWR